MIQIKGLSNNNFLDPTLTFESFGNINMINHHTYNGAYNMGNLYNFETMFKF